MGFRIDGIVACVAIGPDDEEGIMAVFAAGQWVPLVAADEQRLKQIIPMAEIAKKSGGRDYRVVRFKEREDITTEMLARYKP